ncbi:tetratricopeptide repeat protein [Jannaschia marina]|uniref:tetratricopeptide repeat protein n=1 Tax=Jannaschia marina TaxID=2741674 RepID=UPI0015C8A49A|nr:hypothetical protein [Jannaschia marina]
MENKDAILEQLQRIIGSRTFRQAKRLCALLQYSVEETLAGRANAITAPIVALEIFSRDGTIDARSEGLVRVQARQLRMKLSSYYEGEGRDDSIRITIPQGGYSAIFETMRAEPASTLRQAAEIDGIDIGVARIVGAVGDIETELALQATQQHVITHLSRSADLRALWLDNDGAPPLDGPTPRADLVLTGRYLKEGKTPSLTMNLFCGRRHDLIWSQRFEQEHRGTSDEEWLRDVAMRTAVEIGAPSSPVIPHRLRRWRELDVKVHPVTDALLRMRLYNQDPTAEGHLLLRTDFEAILQKGDRRPEVLAALSQLYRDEARFTFNREGTRAESTEKAEDFATEAIRADRYSADAWYVAYQAAYEGTDFRRARAAMERVLALDPLHTDAVADNGSMLWTLGDTKAGLTEVDRAIGLRRHAPGWYWLTHVHEAIRTRDPEKAETLIAKMELPHFFWMVLLRMVAAGLSGDFDKRDALRKKLAREQSELLGQVDAGGTGMPFPKDFLAALRDGATRTEETDGGSAAVTTLAQKARAPKR